MQVFKLKIALVTVGVLVLGGCTTVSRPAGQVDFSYVSQENHPATGKTIAIVAPAFKTRRDEIRDKSSQRAALLAQIQGRVSVKHADFWKLFNNRGYKKQLITALQNNFLETFTNKGFMTKGPYSSFDGMTYIDRKGVYLASVPKLALNIIKKVTRQSCSMGSCDEEGVIQITGELDIGIVEPLTKQTLINKRINLSDFHISEPYVMQQSDPTSTGILGLILKIFPRHYTDDTDKALVDALNEFYAKAAAKIDTYVSTEELISLEPDVKRLKSLKRY